MFWESIDNVEATQLPVGRENTMIGINFDDILESGDRPESTSNASLGSVDGRFIAQSVKDKASGVGCIQSRVARVQ